jgi:hypothetical protein
LNTALVNQAGSMPMVVVPPNEYQSHAPNETN